jgi:hypothetical protein
MPVNETVADPDEEDKSSSTSTTEKNVDEKAKPDPQRPAKPKGSAGRG